MFPVAVGRWHGRLHQFDASTDGAGTGGPPNIVFILVDDMRWDDFAAGGHPFIETPNMDRLAREGVRFLNAFATTPLCSPSRASLLTGQYARTHGIIDNTARPSHNLPVFPIVLRRAGYQYIEYRSCRG